MSEYEGLLPEFPKSATEVLLASMKGESSYDASAYLERLRRENPVIPVSLEGLDFGQEHEIGCVLGSIVYGLLADAGRVPRVTPATASSCEAELQSRGRANFLEEVLKRMQQDNRGLEQLA